MRPFVALGALTALFIALSAYLPGLVSAQTDIGLNPLAFGTNLSIGLSPQYPRPQNTVHLTAGGTGLDLGGSAIVWRAGGKIIAQGAGITSADITAGALGTQTAVEVDVTTRDGNMRSAQALIAPAELDLLVGSDSYTPPFYRGRALPSAGTDLIVQALAHFKRPDGTFAPDSDITYTWKRDTEVLGDISGRGRSSAVIPVMHLFTNDTITVDAVSSDGILSGEASITAPSKEPVLDLYEDHPLYGVLYNRALGSSSFVSESEMAFVAIPYFAQAGSPNDPGLSYLWSVNDARVPPAATLPSELIINADNSNGQAQIALEVTHARNFYMDATGLWGIAFPGGTSAQDRFHTPTQ